MSGTARIRPAWNLQPLTGRSPTQEDSTAIIQPSALATGIIYGMMGANARMMFHGGSPTFQQHFEIFQSEEIRTLYHHTAPTAAYNAKDRYDPPKCHPNTRTGLLNMTRDWANSGRARIMWLYGSVGAGKSAIAQTMSEELRAGSKLAASFFFSRTAPAESHRGHEAQFVATIAYQLTEVIQGLRRHVERAVVDRPSVFDRTLREQTLTLIIEPLKLLCHDNCTRNISPTFPRIIVVYGLDECKDEAGQKQVLDIIEMLVGDWDGVPPFSVFLASRPELAIQSWFITAYRAHPDMMDSASLLDHCDSDSDIKAFVTAEVADIKDFHPFKYQLPPGWPSTQQMDDIVHRASGQFIYASTVMKYVRDPRQYPHLRLDYILKNTIPGSDQPYAELNALYLQILRNSRYPQDVRRVLAFHIFSASFFAEIPSNKFMAFLQQFLKLPFPVDVLLIDLQSIMRLNQGIAHRDRHEAESSTSLITTTPAAFYHASLSEFLLDRRRAAEFYIDMQSHDQDFYELVLEDISALLFSPRKPTDAEYVAISFALLLQTQTVRCTLQGDRAAAELTKWDTLHPQLLLNILEILRPKLMSSDGMEFFDSLGPILTKTFLDALWREVSATHRQLKSVNLPSGLFGLFFDSPQFGFELPVSKNLPDDPTVNVLVTWYMHTCCKKNGEGDVWDFFSDNSSCSLSRMRWVYGSQSLFCQNWGSIQGLSDAGLYEDFIGGTSKAVVLYIRHIASLFSPLTDSSKPQEIQDALNHIMMSLRNAADWRVRTVLELLVNIQPFLWLHCPLSADIVMALEHLSALLSLPSGRSDIEQPILLNFPDLASDDILNPSASDLYASTLPLWFFRPFFPDGASGVTENLGLLHDYIRLFHKYRRACDSDPAFTIPDVSTRKACDVVYDILSLDQTVEDWSYWHRIHGIVRAGIVHCQEGLTFVQDDVSLEIQDGADRPPLVTESTCDIDYIERLPD